MNRKVNTIMCPVDLCAALSATSDEDAKFPPIGNLYRTRMHAGVSSVFFFIVDYGSRL